jgi:hypothetical protein
VSATRIELNVSGGKVHVTIADARQEAVLHLEAAEAEHVGFALQRCAKMAAKGIEAKAEPPKRCIVCDREWSPSEERNGCDAEGFFPHSWGRS